MEKKSVREIISVIFRAVTLAMGVAVVVLSCLGSSEPKTSVILLGIGLACAGAAMLEKRYLTVTADGKIMEDKDYEG